MQGGSSALVVITALNEELGIGPTLKEVDWFLHEPLRLVVDGHSVDGTVKVAEAMGARVVFQRGIGKGDAVAFAMDHARELDVEYIVFIDADFTYPAEYLPQMIEILEENPSVGMVSGNRFNGSFNLGAMHNVLYFGNRALAFVHNLFNGVQMRDPLTGMRVVRSEILKSWTPKSRSFDVEVELNHHVEREGYGIVEIPIHYRRRLGQKKLAVRHGLTILKRILLESAY